MMLFNTATKTYHPILYFEKPFPDLESEGNRKLIRYKSKGHRTNGFTDRQEAIDSIDKEMSADKLKELGYRRNLELEGNLDWDGLDIPADVQLRGREEKVSINN